jgi:hypothetical protein
MHFYRCCALSNKITLPVSAAQTKILALFDFPHYKDAAAKSVTLCS